ELLCAGQRKDALAPPIVLEPIERRLPILLLHARPAIRKPEFRTAIAAIGDESLIFAIAHRTRRDAEGAQQDLMARAFIVEGKALAVMADQRQPPRMFQPF